MATKKPQPKTPKGKKPTPRGGTPRGGSIASAMRPSAKNAKAARKPAEKAPVGRPSLYSVEMASRICMGLLDGKSLRAICADDDMPGLSTVLRWLHDDAGDGQFREQYARAREWAEELSQDECLEIARNVDKVVLGEVVDNRGMKVPVILAYDRTAVARARLEIATRQHLSAQRAPKRWGKFTGTGMGGSGAAEADGVLLVVKDMTGRKD